MNHNDCTIRRIMEKDRAEYLAMCGEFYSTDAVMAPVPKKNFEDCLDLMLKDDTYCAAWIFLFRGRTVGYAQIARTYSQEAGGPVVWVEELYVREECRGMGFGSEFLSLVEQEYPAARLRLEVEEENTGAVRLYSRTGYRFIPYQQMIKGS